MNLSRTLTRNQVYYLKQICSGQLVIEWIPEYRYYAEQYKSRDGSTLLFYAAGRSKARGRAVLRRNHFPDAVTDMLACRVLVDVGGRLMPNAEARRQYGTPPPIPMPRRTFKMSRTRAARVQESAA